MKLKLAFSKKTIAIIIILIVLIWQFIAYENWDLSRIGKEQTVPLSGELAAADGMVKFYPEAMIVDYRGIRLIIRYDIDKELKELGFGYASAPLFAIVKDPKIEPESDGSIIYNSRDRVLADDVLKKTDAKGDYFEARFYFTHIPHYDENYAYRLYADLPGSLIKNVSEEFDVEIGKENKIEFPGIGSYHLNLSFDHQYDQTKLIVKEETISSLKGFFTVNNKIIGIYNNAEYTTGGGSGSGSSEEGNIFRLQGKYAVDTPFISAERYFIRVHSLMLNLKHDPFGGNYLDL